MPLAQNGYKIEFFASVRQAEFLFQQNYFKNIAHSKNSKSSESWTIFFHKDDYVIYCHMYFLTTHDTIDILIKVQLVQFRSNWYSLIFTDHAMIRMEMREINIQNVVEVIETGIIKQKEVDHKFWVYKNFKNRKDNLISVSLAIEGENLIVITVLVNWRVHP